ncbi:MAG: DNA gyrase/topoisomerase IV subunit A [Bacteroidetes bacterium]|jgi:topoisomerase IV subunit A|nr:DNA gyrase/topoisomerase IV subunit A [Bacteroidota bacterium]MBT6686379.1 DNA gyrase/topoisomerase IV subunit A [Bacteroidota bacterium]MBT7142212.1 DNA gyrase/topoisomerase IV subunit A [Bacteroidota bacterium]MBT7490433.1 DNA gyrase/topoisomerase IV subunit A [Bacteroidota bacterium]
MQTEENKKIEGAENEEINNSGEDSQIAKSDNMHNVEYLSGMYKNWFLEYASYVILERAVPHIYDGLKPVQRRILFAMKRLDDGRFNKVANIIGQTMQFHPHGDASIGDAMVQIGQKELLIETQGNWGNIITGDNAAASRYIEARLSKFAIDVVFNSKTTFWKASYDGRNNEPINLPVKFPLLLAQGAEGIAVGLASKILPHNFIELIDASIDFLNDKEFELLPDFPTAGLADFSKYNDGLRGGSVKVRARISKIDKKTLQISEIPFGKTTGSLIDSIVKANEKGKIKIKKIDDNTSENVEILIYINSGISPDKTIDALYAFTDCEISISPNNCVIEEEKPRFLGSSEMLKISAQNTVNLLKKELEIKKSELEDAWHFSSLEKIFIENRIYIEIEDCETWESIIETIDTHLEPFKYLLKKTVVYDDIVKLTEIKIKRISKFDSFKADELIKSIEAEIQQIEYNLSRMVQFAIDYYRKIKNKYGKGRQRKTEIRNFDTIVATKVVVANEKLYINKKEGFIGTSLKKDEFVCDCSDIDDIIAFRRDGKYIITKVSEKSFVGKNIIYVTIFKPNDDRTIYNAIYRDGISGTTLMKRFAVLSIIRDKEYDITQGTANSKIIYFTANPNGEAETIKIFLKPKAKLRRLSFELDFRDLAIKGRNSKGNIITKHDVYKISLKTKGVSTLGGRQIWFDESVLRLSTEERGKFIGDFSGNDKILTITKSGYFQLSGFDLSNHFDEDIVLIEKYNPEKVFSVVFFDADQNYYYLKRFQIDETDKKVSFIGENQNSKFIIFSTDKLPRIEIEFGGEQSSRENEIINVAEFIGIKSYKARGKRISIFNLQKISWIESLVFDENGNTEELEESKSIDEKPLNLEEDGQFSLEL